MNCINKSKRVGSQLHTRLNSFVIADAKLCIGCRVCEIACATSHSSDGEFLTIGNIESPLQPRLYLVMDESGSVPVQCRHCEDAPCANSCPLGAIRQINGTIYIRDEICVGCKSCMLVCPFGAIEIMALFDHGRPVIQNLPLEDAEGGSKQAYFASKCDRCITREEPACVASCPQDALQLFLPEEQKRERMHAAAKGLARLGRGDMR